MINIFFIFLCILVVFELYKNQNYRCLQHNYTRPSRYWNVISDRIISDIDKGFGKKKYTTVVRPVAVFWTLRMRRYPPSLERAPKRERCPAGSYVSCGIRRQRIHSLWCRRQNIIIIGGPGGNRVAGERRILTLLRGATIYSESRFYWLPSVSSSHASSRRTNHRSDIEWMILLYPLLYGQTNILLTIMAKSLDHENFVMPPNIHT